MLRPCTRRQPMRPSSPARSSPARSCCSGSSRCSPRWRCRCSAARRSCGIPPWSFSRPCCWRATPTRTRSADSTCAASLPCTPSCWARRPWPCRSASARIGVPIRARRPRHGCWRCCSRRWVRRSSPWRRRRRCCSAGSRSVAIPTRRIRIFCMPPATRAAWRCSWRFRSCWNRSWRRLRSPSSGRSASPRWRSLSSPAARRTGARVRHPRRPGAAHPARPAGQRRRDRPCRRPSQPSRGGNGRGGWPTARYPRPCCSASPPTSAPTSPRHRSCGWCHWRCTC